MKISMSSFVFCHYPLKEAIRRIASAGFEGVDIWGGRPHAYRRDLDQAECGSTVRLLNDLSLATPSFIPAQFRYPTCLCSPDETIWRDSGNYIRDSITTASWLGARVVSLCPGHSLFGQRREDAWQRLCANLLDLCDFAASLGVKLAIEPADRYETDLVQTTAQALQLLDDVKRGNLGVVLDVGHCQLVGESPADAIRRLGDTLLYVHVNDNLGQRDQHLVPGQGVLDFPAILAALREVGYEGFLSTELGWDYTIDPEPATRRSADFLRALLASQP